MITNEQGAAWLRSLSVKDCMNNMKAYYDAKTNGNPPRGLDIVGISLAEDGTAVEVESYRLGQVYHEGTIPLECILNHEAAVQRGREQWEQLQAQAAQNNKTARDILLEGQIAQYKILRDALKEQGMLPPEGGEHE